MTGDLITTTHLVHVALYVVQALGLQVLRLIQVCLAKNRADVVERDTFAEVALAIELQASQLVLMADGQHPPS